MVHVVVSTEVETWETRKVDPSDSWDQGDSAGRVSNVTAYVTAKPQTYYGDSHGKDLDVEPGTTVYAVVADYESGCTFGRSGGHSQVLDFFTDSVEAEALAEVAVKPDSTRRNWNGEDVPDTSYAFDHKGVHYYRAWVGYFESLNSLDVWQVQVKRSAKDPWSDDPKPGYKVGR